MSAIRKAENTIGGLFKGVPNLPDSSKESLAKAWPWIALVFGILQVLAAWGLWGVVRLVDRTADIVNTYSIYYTGNSVALSGMDKTLIYLGVLVLLVDGVLLLLAFPKLKNRSRSGWDLLFLGALLNLGYAVLSLFIRDRGIGTFIMNLIGSGIGFYLLFQVREKFVKQ